MRDIDQSKEETEREIQIEEINLIDFTEMVEEHRININKGTETPREIDKEIGHDYGKDEKQIKQGVRKKNHKEDTEINKKKGTKNNRR